MSRAIWLQEWVGNVQDALTTLCSLEWSRAQPVPMVGYGDHACCGMGNMAWGTHISQAVRGMGVPTTAAPSWRSHYLKTLRSRK